MESKNFRNTALGAGALLAVLALKDCQEPQKAPAPKVQKVQTAVRAKIHHETAAPQVEEVQPYTVDLRGLMNADGTMRSDFNFVAAVRDCVEATGQFDCTDYVGGAECYFLEPKGPMLNVFVGRPIDFNNPQTGVFVGGTATGWDKIPYGANDTDLEGMQSQMDLACNDAIDLGSTVQEWALHNRSAFTMLVQGVEAAALPKKTAELFEDLSENDFEPKDMGGNNFVVDAGGITYTIRPVLELNSTSSRLMHRDNEDLDFGNYSGVFDTQFTLRGLDESTCASIEDLMDAIEDGTACQD